MPTPEWGLMIAQGVQDINSGVWWTAVFPGLALTATVASFAVVGCSL
jgi:peptide/nickel transport system permease protein